MTELERIEEQRREHVLAATIEAVGGADHCDTEMLDKLADAAKAAMVAVDRFPKDPTVYPFNRHLGKVPERLHPSTAKAFNEIDAGLFSGDCFYSTDAHLYFAAHVQRWSKQLRLLREDDYWNRPDPDDEEPDCE